MKNLDVEILIPTMFKTLEQIKNLCSFWNLQSNATISVQCDKDDFKSFEYKNYKIDVIFSTTRGVSKNRNILINSLKSKYGFFIDDDCSMVDGYVELIADFIGKHQCEIIYFNGFDNYGKLITKRKTSVVKHFSKVSYAGGPGIFFNKQVLLDNHIFFNEKVGTPNLVYCGEDSLFVYSCVKKRIPFYRNNAPIFKVVNDLDNSTYFKGYDEQYFQSKGAINKLIYPKSYFFHYLYLSVRLMKRSKKNPFFIMKNLMKGRLIAKAII